MILAFIIVGANLTVLGGALLASALLGSADPWPPLGITGLGIASLFFGLGGLVL